PPLRPPKLRRPKASRNRPGGRHQLFHPTRRLHLRFRPPQRRKFRRHFRSSTQRRSLPRHPRPQSNPPRKRPLLSAPHQPNPLPRPLSRSPTPQRQRLPVPTTNRPPTSPTTRSKAPRR